MMDAFRASERLLAAETRKTLSPKDAIANSTMPYDELRANYYTLERLSLELSREVRELRGRLGR